MEKEIKVPIVKKCEFISSRTGNPYQCLVIEYKGYEKRVFLDIAEDFIFDDVPISNKDNF